MKHHILSGGRPTHWWFKKVGFRRHYIAWTHGEQSFAIDVCDGYLRQQARMNASRGVGSCIVLQVNRTAPTPTVPFDFATYRAWLSGPPFETLSEMNYGDHKQARVCEHLTWSELQKMVTNLRWYSQMPAEVFVDWLREKLPLVELILSGASLTSQTQSALSS